MYIKTFSTYIVTVCADEKVNDDHGNGIDDEALLVHFQHTELPLHFPPYISTATLLLRVMCSTCGHQGWVQSH